MSHLLHVSLNCLEMLNGRDLYHTRPRPPANLWNTVQQIPCRLSTSQLHGRLSTSAFPFHGRLSMPAFPFHVPEHPTPFAAPRPCQLDFCWSFALFWAGCLFNLCSFTSGALTPLAPRLSLPWAGPDAGPHISHCRLWHAHTFSDMLIFFTGL